VVQASPFEPNSNHNLAAALIHLQQPRAAVLPLRLAVLQSGPTQTESPRMLALALWLSGAQGLPCRV
jgi:hypothetical protein